MNDNENICANLFISFQHDPNTLDFWFVAGFPGPRLREFQPWSDSAELSNWRIGGWSFYSENPQFWDFLGWQRIFVPPCIHRIRVRQCCEHFCQQLPWRYLGCRWSQLLGYKRFEWSDLFPKSIALAREVWHRLDGDHMARPGETVLFSSCRQSVLGQEWHEHPTDRGRVGLALHRLLSFCDSAIAQRCTAAAQAAEGETGVQVQILEKGHHILFGRIWQCQFEQFWQIQGFRLGHSAEFDTVWGADQSSTHPVFKHGEDTLDSAAINLSWCFLADA